MNSHFSIKGKCSICYKKSSVCKRLICEILEPRSIFLLTSKLRIDSEKYKKTQEENRLICIQCYEILYTFYRKVEKKFYENINLALINNADTELRKFLCCLCKQQHKKVLRPIELGIWMCNEKLIKNRFGIDFKIEDITYRNACLNCYNYLLFLATFFNTINHIQKKSKLETISEEQEDLVTDLNEPCQGTSAIKNWEVIELYRRDGNSESTSSSCHFLMADQLKFIEKEKAGANQTRFSKFWRRLTKRSSSHSAN